MAPGSLSFEQLADRAGVSAAFVRRLVDRRILVPDGERFVPADVRRARLIDGCERAGMSVDAIGQAIDEGLLSLAYLEGAHYRWTAFTGETYAELAERMQLPLDLVQELVSAMGARRPAGEDRTREDDDEVLEVIRIVAPAVDRDALVSIARVYADGLRRMAEAEAVLFETFMVGRLVRAGMPYGKAVEQASLIGAELNGPHERMLVAMYRRQQERGWTEGLIEGIERVIDEMGSYERPARPPAFAFVDLANYTLTTIERCDRHAAAAAAELSRVVTLIAADHEGKPVKWLGDGVMIHFRRPAPAVLATLEIVEEMPRSGLPAHAGIAAGPVVMQDGDYFGRTVNLAARLAASAGEGQTLVSREVAEDSRDVGVAFDATGPLALKGFATPVPVYEARLLG